MNRKSVWRFSEKIMLKQKDGAGRRFEEKSSRSRVENADAVVWPSSAATIASQALQVTNHRDRMARWRAVDG
jgi:hypothetical protein